MNNCLLMMGGSGTRLGTQIPKQYIEVDGVPIFAYILDKLNKFDAIDNIVIVSNPAWIDYVEDWKQKLGANKVKAVVAGGATRSESVLNGLKVTSELANDDDVILIHDATHPYVDEAGTLGVIEGVKRYGGATLGEYQYDTCYRIDENNFIVQVENRRELVAGASPEAFFFGDIYRIYSSVTTEELETMTSAGAIALAHGIKMVVVPCNIINLKITYKNDFDAFLKTVHSYFFE